ncbi:hypothetical protein U9M48_004427 [Paspalum notatum var. saurae]|uniref:Reverse transcriptase domain-containing protein n=1 Tax=Paspalum notatum var. saurae TaxID=547442 RepID=A0AAQ3PUR9_PASNO
MEGAVILHETLHELHKKKKNGVILKINFEKAYDKVRWNFLQQTLRMIGFSYAWCTWIKSFVQGRNVGIKINDQMGPYFQTRKSLRQGDPLSPILFNIVADILAIILARAKEGGQINGVIPHLVDDGLSILQYADDTIIFMDHDLAQANSMKLLLCAFEQLSGLNINFHKSEILCFGQAKEFESTYSHLFGCKTGTFPFRYMGIPLHYRKLKNTDWRMVEERSEKRLSGWKGKLLYVGERLVLINTVLSSLPMFILSFFEVPRGVLKRMDYFRSRFFWQIDQHKKKYWLAKWEILCQPKDQGGLGILDLDLQNRSLLSKWLFKLCKKGIWQQLLRNKYLRNWTLSQVERKPGDSHFWSSLMGVKAQFLNLGSFILKNWTQVRFWEDTLLGGVALKYQFPLFNIVRKTTGNRGRSLRRSLLANKLRDWENIVARVMNLNLQEENDYFKWHLHKNGIFSVRSMYRYLVNNGVKVSMEIWQSKLPLKIKIFLWYLKKAVLLTKDNLGRLNWHGVKSCCFCGTSETIQHLFLDCSYAKFLWRTV